MKFLCIDCDTQMTFDERELPGDGTFAVSFACPACGRRMAMLTNQLETQLVSSMDVGIGGRTLPEEPMEMIRAPSVREGRRRSMRSSRRSRAAGGDVVVGRTGAIGERAQLRARHGEKIYADYAQDRGIVQITPEVMDRARTELGLEGM